MSTDDPNDDLAGKAAPMRVQDLVNRQIDNAEALSERVSREVQKVSGLPNVPLIDLRTTLNLAPELQRHLAQWDSLVRAAQIPQALSLQIASAVKGLNTSGHWEVAKSVESFRLVVPKFDELQRLSEAVARLTGPSRAIADLVGDRSASLTQRMARLQTPWAIEGRLDFSVQAYAKLARFADLAQFGQPFAEDTYELVAEELGSPIEAVDGISPVEREELFDDAGRDPELVAFPATAYSGVLYTAGFTLALPPPPLPVIIEGPAEAIEYNFDAGGTLISMEGHLRAFVQRCLFEMEGTAWIKRRVPEALRRDWAEEKERQQALGKPVYDLIHYAHFMNLGDIMTQKGNWDQVFSAFFPSKEALRVSLNRLYSVRNDFAHARPMTKTDSLIVMTEATLLARALGIISTTGH